jgi:hypothetical protein
MPAFYELNYYARTFYSGNGSTNDFLVTFYGGAPLDPSHVRVYVNQTQISSGWSFVTINGATYVHFDIPPDGQTPGNVMLRRFTPAREADRVINFTDGDVLTASDLDMSQLNSLYVSQESSDQFLDQGGAGVSINFAETITGSKTFTGTTTIAPEGSFKFLQGLDIIADKTPDGKQYVLGANGTSGDVHWEETTINAGSLPATVVLTDTNQTIDGQKTFTGAVEINAPLKVTGSAVSGKALVSSTNDGSVAWSSIVNGIKLGSDTAVSSTGTVVITPASIGALSAGASGGTQTVAGPVAFTGSVGLGDEVSADTLTVTGQLKLNLSDTDEVIGRVLTCNAIDGTASWASPAATGITSVNGLTGSTTGGVVEITPALLGVPVLVGSPQTIAAITTFSSTVNLGDDGNDIVNIPGKLYYTRSGYASGHVMTSQPNGEVIWAAVPPTGVISVNGDSSSAVTITAAGLGAVDLSSNQTIAGVKTFSGTASAANAVVTNALTYNVGSNLQGKVLTSNASGVASWASPSATGVTSVNDQTGPTVTLDAADVGAVSVGYSQEITGAKTFSNNVTLGTASNDIIVVGGELQIPGATANGQVLTSSAGNKAIWATPEPAGVTMLNGATGPLTISADSLGAYTPAGAYPLPIATGNQKGIMQVGGGLSVTDGVVSVTQNATLPIATADVLGGIKIGSGLSINSATGVVSATLNGSVGVNLFKGRAGDVTPEVNDYQASMIKNIDGSDAAVTTDSIQTISAAKKFTVAPTVTSSGTTIGTNGSNGVSIEPTGLVKAQRAGNGNLHVWEGYSPTGGLTSFIEADGDAVFSGLVTANGGFYSNAGVTFGDNPNDGINLTGTLKFTGGGAPELNKVMTCKDSLGTVAWEYPLNAPVTTVNGTNGSVSISLHGEANPTANLGGVSLTATQTISGAKTFSANQVFQANVTLGDAGADVILVNGTLKIPMGGSNGKFLKSDASGNASWGDGPAVPVQSVNGVSGAVIITADDPDGPSTKGLGAVTKGTTQTITGNKTFSGTTSFTGNVSLGDALSDTLTCTATPVFPSGAVVGHVLTCADADGATAWGLPTPPLVISVNGRVDAVTITADETTTGIGAVTKDTAQSISGVKTFSVAQIFNAGVTLGDAGADVILVNGTLRIPTNPAAGRVLTSDSTGNASWANQTITSVSTQIGAAAPVAQTGAVLITATNIGAATTGALTTLTGQVTDAVTLATNASLDAAAAAGVAATKLSSVTITTTDINNLPVSCLSGLGTAASPLKVLGAAPLGPATGDLTGSYPSPTIGNNKVTYGKMQQVAGYRLLGNPAVSGPANVAEISLGTGLGFVAGQLTNTAIPTVSATGTNTFTGANTFQGNVVVGNEATDTLSVNAAVTTNGTVILGSTNNAANAITIGGPLKITSGSPAAGKFLTTDASGNATWASPTPTPVGIPTFIGSMATWQPVAQIGGTAPNLIITPSFPLGVEQLIPWSISITSSSTSARTANLLLNPGTQSIRVNGIYRTANGTMAGNAASHTAGFDLKPLPVNTNTQVALITMAATPGGSVPNTQTGYVSVTRIA